MSPSENRDLWPWATKTGASQLRVEATGSTAPPPASCSRRGSIGRCGRLNAPRTGALESGACAVSSSSPHQLKQLKRPVSEVSSIVIGVRFKRYRPGRIG